MKTNIIIALYITILSCAFSAEPKAEGLALIPPPANSIGRSQDKFLLISIYKAIVTPEKFIGAPVAIKGLFYKDSGGALIFPTTDQRRVFDISSAIRIPLKLKNGEKIPDEFENHFVTVEGILGYDSQRNYAYIDEVVFVGVSAVVDR